MNIIKELKGKLCLLSKLVNITFLWNYFKEKSFAFTISK